MIEKILISLLGYSFGMIISFATSGQVEGHQGLLPDLLVKVGERTIIFHHWIYFTLLLVFIGFIQWKTNLIPPIILYFLVSFCLGCINQGLTYKDWYNFLRS